MLDQLLPRSPTATYHGRRLALWLLGVVALMNGAIGVNSLVNGPAVATSADGIPLASFSPDAAATVVALFGLLGLSRLVLAVFAALVLARYRGLVPLAFGLLLLDHLGRRLTLYFLPIPRVGAPPAGVVNAVFLALLIGGLALSVWRRGEGPPPAAG